MALYYNGKMVAGVNSMPELTQAQYDALEVKPEFWIRTDAPDDYGRVPASEVGFDNSDLGNNGTNVQDTISDINFGLIPKTTTFNPNGSISVEGEGFETTTVFNADGSITETVTVGGVTTTKTTTFVGSSIIESLSGGGSVIVTDKAPYTKRQSLRYAEASNYYYDELVGGTVAWNQLVQNGNFVDTSEWSSEGGSFTVSNNIATITTTDSWQGIKQGFYTFKDHVYLFSGDIKKNTASDDIKLYQNNKYTPNLTITIPNDTNWHSTSMIGKAVDTQYVAYPKFDNVTAGASWQQRNINLFDLTQAYGSSIANYVYGLETATPGAGLAYLKSYGFFTKSYYANDTGSLQSVNVSEHKFEGKNLLPMTTINDLKALNTTGTWDENVYSLNAVTFTIQEDTNGNIVGIVVNSDGATGNADFKVTDDYSWIENGTIYTMTGCPAGGTDTSYRLYVNCYYNSTSHVFNDKGNGADCSWDNIPALATFSVLVRIVSGTSCNNLLFKPMIRYAFVEDDIFTPYHAPLSYALDSSKQLRGLFKLDSNNRIYADGDIYSSNGSTAKVTRKYGIVDLGSLEWVKSTTASGYRFYTDIISNIEIPLVSEKGNLICSVYTALSANETYNDFSTKIGIAINNNARLLVVDRNYEDAAAFKTAMSGVYAIYALETATVESAAVFTNPQFYDKFGTEEYVDYGVAQSTRDVAIPVGHTTKYIKV